jgi:threonylcarbamoyladenosine tRNA methylthiotransferase MtaB
VTRPSLAFQTFGCRLNQAESEGWQSELAARGYAIADRSEADVFCVHSCAVTEPAVKEVTRLLRAVRQQRPELKIILSGCAAELVKEVAIDLRIPHAQKGEWLTQTLSFLQAQALPATTALLPPPRHRTRAWLIIQDGCDQFCAYCIVPHLRGAPV